MTVHAEDHRGKAWPVVFGFDDFAEQEPSLVVPVSDVFAFFDGPDRIGLRLMMVDYEKARAQAEEHLEDVDRRMLEAMNQPARAQEPKGGRPGTVYVLQAGEHCKIGWTRSLGSRLKQVQCGNPHEVRVVFTAEVTDPRRVEARLHAEFLGARVRGEWFVLSESDLARIAAQLGVAG